MFVHIMLHFCVEVSVDRRGPGAATSTWQVIARGPQAQRNHPVLVVLLLVMYPCIHT